MDTSKEYIEMCRKAVEIQNLCPFEQGDFILNTSAIAPPEGFLFVNYKHQPYDNFNHWELIYRPLQRKSFNIWLPRQDQLQDMLKDYDCFKDSDYIIFSYWFWRFVLGENINYKFNSFEKLWLAFVMHEKYGKKWNGDDWEACC